MSVSRVFPHMDTPLGEMDLTALLLVLMDRPLGDSDFHPRVLIDVLKNDPPYLERLLEHMADEQGDVDVGAGGYFYRDVKSNATFDLYKKYNITAQNLREECVTEEQWNYLFQISYISEQQYDQGFA